MTNRSSAIYQIGLRFIPVQIIPPTLDDDIVSVCDWLDWLDDKRVLLTLPEGETAVQPNTKTPLDCV